MIMENWELFHKIGLSLLEIQELLSDWNLAIIYLLANFWI